MCDLIEEPFSAAHLFLFLRKKNFYIENKQKIHKGQSGVSCVSKLLLIAWESCC